MSSVRIVKVKYNTVVNDVNIGDNENICLEHFS